MTKQQTKYILYGIVILHIGIIWYLGAMQGDTSSKLSMDTAVSITHIPKANVHTKSFFTFHVFLRKLAHFVEYFSLGFFVKLALGKLSTTKTKVAYIVYLILVPTIDEWIQHITPGRCGAMMDVVLDQSGFLCGSLLALLLWNAVKNHRVA